MAKRAVLVGCNYPGTKAELHGCVNDVWRMHKALVERFGFDEQDITVLIDTDDSYTQPTGANIKKALNDLISRAEPGDVLFFHYSGHGTRLPAETGEDDDTGYDECIVPCDMNLMNDDDFREFVDRVPRGATLTIVSDSCHSGGLIDHSKEQIGDSCQDEEQEGRREYNEEEGEERSGGGGGGGWRGMLKQGLKQAWESGGVREALESRGLDVGGWGLGGGGSHGRRREEGEEEEEGGSNVAGGVKNRALSLDTLLEMLRERTGRQDIEVGSIRPTLYDMFGEDSSSKVKKFVKVFVMGRLGGHQADGSEPSGGGDGGLMGMVGSLAGQFLQQKLDDSSGDSSGWAKPALETPTPADPSAAYAGKRGSAGAHDMGILISGCQSSQTSADANPGGGSDSSQAYGALSNAIQTILQTHSEPITLRQLVSEARRLLASQGFSQQPGLYCTDENAESIFIC